MTMTVRGMRTARADAHHALQAHTWAETAAAQDAVFGHIPALALAGDLLFAPRSPH